MTISTWHTTLYIMWLLCTAAVLTQCVCYLTPPAYLWLCQYVLVLATLYSSLSLWAERYTLYDMKHEETDKREYMDSCLMYTASLHNRNKWLCDVISAQRRQLKKMNEKHHTIHFSKSFSEGDNYERKCI